MESSRVNNSGGQEINTTAKVLIALGVFWGLFVIAMCVIYCVKGSVPDTLIQCVLGGSGFEVAALTAIKISKVISGTKLGKGESYESLDSAA